MRSSTATLFAASSAILVLLVALDLRGRKEILVPAAEQAPSDGQGISSDSLDAPTLRVLGQPERLPISVSEGAAVAESKARANQSSDGDVTVLRVRVLGPDGSPQRAGNLECLAGERSFPEAQALSVHLCVPIQAAVTELVLPASCLEAVLVASGPSGPPTLHREEDLRLVDDVFQVSGRVEKDVSILLQATDEESMVEGRILVDGIPRVPEGLRVLLVRERSRSASIEQVLDRMPSLALVDRAARTYRAGPLSSAVQGLWATSTETVPLWIPIEWSEGQGNLRLDLDCASGRTLHLSCVDAATGEPAPRVALETQTLTKISSAGDQEFFRPNLGRVCTDENGRCTIRGVPETGVFRLTLARKTPAPRTGAGFLVAQSETCLLDLELDPGSPREFWETLRLSRAEVRTARVFGSSHPSDPWFDRPGSFRIVWRPTGAHEAPLGLGCELSPGADWELRLPMPAEYDLWIERDRSRVSETVTLALRSEADIGPIQFAPRPLVDVLLHWRRAPEGADLRISAHAARGAEPLAFLPAVAEAGEAPLQLGGPTRLSLELRDAESPPVEHSIEWDPAQGPRIDVDFRAGAAASIELSGDPDLISGASEIWLLGAEPGHSSWSLRAAVPIEAGRSVRAVSLPPGRYFWRLRGPANAFVIGWFDLPEGSAAPSLRLACEVKRSRIEELASSDVRALEALTIRGIALESWVPIELRRLDLTEFGAAAASAAEPPSYWLPADWSFRLLP
jgi:hypothetical protein